MKVENRYYFCNSMPHLTQMLWDAKDRLLKTSLNPAQGGTADDTNTTWYRYDLSGQRVRKICIKNNITEERIYLSGCEIYRRTNSGVLQTERQKLHIDVDQKKIAFVETLTVADSHPLTTPESLIRYQYDNHLGSACLELDASAAIISYEEYHPFGTTSYRSGRTVAEVSLKRYKYVGKERDEESGLYYYGARYYAAWLCRFVSVDPLKEKYPYLSPFQYTNNNPIIFIDKDGKDFGVNVNHKDRFIVIKMNIYTANEKSYKQAIAAANEINNLYATVSINKIPYQIKFQTNVIPPTNIASISAQKDPIGNLYSGATVTTNVSPDKWGNFSAQGGTTEKGWNVNMNSLVFSDEQTKSYDMGNYSKLVGHEFFHLMGLDDKGGKFYDRKGRMVYNGGRDNNFNMKDISTGDVLNILNYAKEYGTPLPIKKAGDKSKVFGPQAIISEEGKGNFKFGEIDNIKMDATKKP